MSLSSNFFDTNGDPIDISSIDVLLIYKTKGWEQYNVSRIAGVETNCYLDSEDPSKLHIVFENHNLQAGDLTREITLKIENSAFKDGVQNIIYNPSTDIELVAIGGEQESEAGSNSIPVIVQSHTMPEKRKYC